MIAPVLTRDAQRHIRRMVAAIRPHGSRLARQFQVRLRARPFDAGQIRSFQSITPLAAAGRRTVSAFLQQAHAEGRRLARFNLQPAEVREMLGEFDALAAAALDNAHAPAREQLQLATTAVLNQAFYEMRENEAQAFFGLYRAQVEAAGLDDLLHRIVRILTHTFRARSGRLVLTDVPTVDKLARRGAHWCYPIRGAGVLELGFGNQHCWLPRDLTLLTAAVERCEAAIEYRRMEAREREAEENERRRIGRELHDETGQSLLVLRMSLELMERRAPEAFREALRDARSIVEKTVEELRRIVAALSPAVLDRMGLEAALRQLSARFQRTCRAKVGVRLGEIGPVAAPVQQVIYRVAQECLQNAAKHSRATRVNLSLRKSDKWIRLSVSDNGAGFTVGVAEAKPLSFGLAGMRERAALLGGTLTLRTAPRKGATVVLRLPNS